MHDYPKPQCKHIGTILIMIMPSITYRPLSSIS